MKYTKPSQSTKTFEPSSWLLQRMIENAEAAFEADREQNLLRRDSVREDERK